MKNKTDKLRDALNNKKFLRIAAVLFFVVLFSFDLLYFTRASANDSDPLAHISAGYTSAKPILFVHDVSPKYFSALKQVVSITDQCHFQNRTYLFLIVYHHGIYDMKDYPRYVSYLKKLQKEGYHIEYHAYYHNGPEFLCSGKVAEEKLKKSLAILRKCGFDTTKIKYFIPPEGKLTSAAESVFLRNGFTVITPGFITYRKNGKTHRKRISYREYTWYLKMKNLRYTEICAFMDYYDVPHHQYCLSVHPVAVNTPAGLKFLRFALKFNGRP